MAARTWAQTWLKPEAYPIFVCIGGACLMSIAQCSRQMSSSPDVRIVKSDRALGVLEEKKFVKEGAEFREHSLRRFLRDKTPMIFATLNTKFSAAE